MGQDPPRADGHDHAHGHAGGRIGVAFGLNVGFTLLELVGAWLTGSTAIAADALHDLGDSLSLAFAWGMEGLASQSGTASYSYGFRRLSLVGALVNAIVLLVGGVLVLTRAVPAMFDPGTPDAQGMLLLALLGVAVNGAAVLRMRSGSTLNERVVTWHLIEDVLGWIAVLVVSVVMLVVELPILDPLLSLAITVWVGWNALLNLRRTVEVFLQAVPEGIDVDRIREQARAIEGVRDLKHVHVWSQEGEHHVLTGHLVVDSHTLEEAEAVRERVRSLLTEAGIEHATLETVSSGRAVEHPTPCA